MDPEAAAVTAEAELLCATLPPPLDLMCAGSVAAADAGEGIGWLLTFAGEALANALRAEDLCVIARACPPPCTASRNSLLTSRTAAEGLGVRDNVWLNSSTITLV